MAKAREMGLAAGHVQKLQDTIGTAAPPPPFFLPKKVEKIKPARNDHTIKLRCQVAWGGTLPQNSEKSSQNWHTSMQHANAARSAARSADPAPPAAARVSVPIVSNASLGCHPRPRPCMETIVLWQKCWFRKTSTSTPPRSQNRKKMSDAIYLLSQLKSCNSSVTIAPPLSSTHTHRAGAGGAPFSTHCSWFCP
jgi:hypothetical protein